MASLPLAWILFLSLGILASGCRGSGSLPGESDPGAVKALPPSSPAGAVPASIVEALLGAARDYPSYSRVDDETRWAPELCRTPLPGQARWSAPRAADHGQKLYSVFARFRREYVQEGPPAQPVGQVLVKESWIPKEISTEEWEKAMAGADRENVWTRGWNPFARHDGRIYRASEKSGLFIMVKTGGPESETDGGWVYGTVSADGRRVTSAGRLPACMSCHQSARGDRLFGLPPSR